MASIIPENPDYDDEKQRFHQSFEQRVGQAAILGAGTGLLMGSTALAWYPDWVRYGHKSLVVPKSLGAAYVLRNLRGPVLWTSLICVTFTATECLLENVREQGRTPGHTWVNALGGGAAAGAVLGGLTRRFDIMGATALGMGLLMGMVEYNGSRFYSDQEYIERKMMGRQPRKFVESPELDGLKKKYPEWRNM